MIENSGQTKAVESIDGQLLVIAGPGSGKTTTMLARINHMVTDCHIPTDSILMITFSKAAAEEMEKRYKKQYNTGSGVYFSTIHALCWRILQKYAGYKADQVITETQVWQFLKDLIRRDKEINDKESFITNFLTDVSVFRNNGIKIDEYEQKCTTNHAKFKEIYEAYRRHKQTIKRIDFDDMQILALQQLMTRKDVLHELQNRFRYIMVDEYQDTNILQRNIVYLLAGKNGNLAVVGDDDQSIYAFRGARPQIMLDFKKDFPNAEVANLETNYRSLSTIIEHSQALIRQNKNRFAKNLSGFRDGNGTYMHYDYEDKETEITRLAEMIQQDINNGIDANEIAVLYRTNQQSERPASAMLEKGIQFYSNDPFKCKYDHWIYQDVIAYHKLAVGEGGISEMFQVINHPNRYLTKECAYCGLDEEKMVQAAVRNKSQGWQIDAAILEVQRFMQLVRLMDGTPAAGMKAMEGYNYKNYFKDYGYEDEDTLSAVWDELKQEAQKFPTWDAWQQYASDYTNRMKTMLKKRKGVCLSTMHKAKGLEWKKVYLIDAIQGMNPYVKATSEEEIEEERRLFYVAMTRAKDDLAILSYRKGSSKKVSPTQFSKEIKDQIAQEAEEAKNQAIDELVRKADAGEKLTEEEQRVVNERRAAEKKAEKARKKAEKVMKPLAKAFLASE